MNTSKNTKKKINWRKIISKLVLIGLISITLITIMVCIILCNVIPKSIISKYEIIDLSLTFYGSFSLVLLVLQLIISKQDSRARHDEKRREKTVDYMLKWSESLSWETAYAIRVIETLNHQQCINLYNNIPFEVDYTTKEMLCPICSRYLKETCNDCLHKQSQKNTGCNKCLNHQSDDICATQIDNGNVHNNDSMHINSEKEKMFLIDKRQCAEIRWYVIKYLNHLEALLISWKEGIVDREIIEEQFYHLYDPKSGKDTLQSFRHIAGNGKAYPTIEEFCLELRKKRQETNNKLKEIL